MENKNVISLATTDPRFAVALLLVHGGYLRPGANNNWNQGPFQYNGKRLETITGAQNFDSSRTFNSLEQAVDYFVQNIRNVDLSTISQAA